MIDGQPCYIIVDALINFILLQCIQHILIYFSIFNIFNSTIGVLCVCGNALYPLLDIWGHLGIHVRHSVLEGVLGVSKTTHTDCCKPSNIKAVVRTVYKLDIMITFHIHGLGGRFQNLLSEYQPSYPRSRLSTDGIG